MGSRWLLNEQQDVTWRKLARHVMPRLLSAGDLQESGEDGLPKEICSHAASAVLKLASAQSILITLMSEHWFSYEAKPPGRKATDNEKKWFADATEVAHHELRKSNFCCANIATTIDRIFGTGTMLAENNKKGRLVFRHVPLGTFGGAEDADDMVDTVARRFKYTAHQAAGRFGVDALDEQMKTAYDDPKARYKTQFEVWHLCVPRDIASNGNADNLNVGTQMSWASVYISPRSQKVMLEEGYEEFPYLFTRFLKVGPQVFGKSPLEDIESVIKKYLEWEESVNELTKKAAFPPVLTTADMTPEELDLRAGCVTILKEKALASNMPREWASSGRINDSLPEKEEKKKEIDDALFVTQLQSVSSQDRPMTATEVIQRKNEQLRTFSDTFTQFMADFKAWTRNKDFVPALTTLLGKDGYQNLSDWIDLLELGGVQDCLNMGVSQEIISGLYGTGAVAILGFHVQTLIRQLPSIFNGLLWSPDISAAEWLVSGLSPMKHGDAPMTYKRMVNSTLIKMRQQGKAGNMAGQAVRSGDTASSTAEGLLMASMLPMEWMDARCTAIGLVPVWNVYYQRAVDQGASAQEAEQAAWEQTALVANLASQPIGWLNKSKIAQRRNPIVKSAFYMLSENMAKFALCRALWRGGKKMAAFRAWLVYGAANAAISAMLDALQGDPEEFEKGKWWEYVFSAFYGPASGIPGVGEALEAAVNTLLNLTGEVADIDWMKKMKTRASAGRALV
ncbi:MAG: portal protein, partial [Akkermansia sp.]|nr:portal protein [Akkermansia sp.]